MNPGKSLPAEVRYELTIISGPRKLKLRGEEFEIAAEGDLAVIERITTMGNLIVDRIPIAVVGGQWRADATEFLLLRDFLKRGGVIGLDRNIE